MTTAKIGSKGESIPMLGLRKYLKRLRHLQSTGQGILNETGGAIVEMAVSSSVLFAMFFGIFEFAFASYSYNYVSDAAREGARWAIVRGSTSCANTPNLTNCGASYTDIANHVKAVSYTHLTLPTKA